LRARIEPKAAEILPFCVNVCKISQMRERAGHGEAGELSTSSMNFLPLPQLPGGGLTVLLAAQAPSFRAGIAVEFVSFCRIL
jgi:hypothetical protein